MIPVSHYELDMNGRSKRLAAGESGPSLMLPIPHCKLLEHVDCPALERRLVLRAAWPWSAVPAERSNLVQRRA